MNDHTELKKQYTLDVLLHPEGKPWEWWECRFDIEPLWEPLSSIPNWFSSCQYRRKDTAPDWTQELSVKEVAECDDWPDGFEATLDTDGQYAIRDEGCYAIWWQGFGFNHNCTMPQRENLLNHFKIRRCATLNAQLTPPQTSHAAQNHWHALPEDAEARKTYPIYSGFIKYFPHAIAAVSHLSFKGNRQHHDGKPLHWDMDKSTDEPDALMRHLIETACAENKGKHETEAEQATRVAWRAMAHLERLLTGKVVR